MDDNEFQEAILFLNNKEITSNNLFEEIKPLSESQFEKVKKYIICFSIVDKDVGDVLNIVRSFFEKEPNSKLNPLEQIYWLMIHGVSVKNIKEAKNFLTNKNYFYKIISYVKCFPNDNYTFEQLKDISTIDMELRYVLLKACLDVEHAIKTFLSRIVTNSADYDGYNIVEDVFKEQSGENLKEKIFSPFGHFNNEGIFTVKVDYEEEYKHPSFWFVMENASLGKIGPFANHMSREHPDNTKLNLINSAYYQITKLRNKAAHSNNIINRDIIKNEKCSGVDKDLYTELRLKNVPKNLLRIPLVSRISILIFIHEQLTSPAMHNYRMQEIMEISDRCKRIEYDDQTRFSKFTNSFEKLLTVMK